MLIRPGSWTTVQMSFRIKLGLWRPSPLHKLRAQGLSYINKLSCQRWSTPYLHARSIEQAVGNTCTSRERSGLQKWVSLVYHWQMKPQKWMKSPRLKTKGERSWLWKVKRLNGHIKVPSDVEIHKWWCKFPWTLPRVGTERAYSRTCWVLDKRGCLGRIVMVRDLSVALSQVANYRVQGGMRTNNKSQAKARMSGP